MFAELARVVECRNGDFDPARRSTARRVGSGRVGSGRVGSGQNDADRTRNVVRRWKRPHCKYYFHVALLKSNTKQASLLGLAQSYTGAQTNTNLQSDNDFNAVIGSGQVVNTGGNYNTTDQYAFSNATNVITSVQ